MIKILIIISLTISTASAEEDFNVYVNSFDEDADLSSLDAKEIKKTKGSGSLKNISEHLPSPSQMMHIFSEAGLAEETGSMDQVERDLFFLKVANKSLGEIQLKYPTMKLEKIAKLKNLIRSKK